MWFFLVFLQDLWILFCRSLILKFGSCTSVVYEGTTSNFLKSVMECIANGTCTYACNYDTDDFVDWYFNIPDVVLLYLLVFIFRLWMWLYIVWIQTALKPADYKRHSQHSAGEGASRFTSRCAFSFVDMKINKITDLTRLFTLLLWDKILILALLDDICVVSQVLNQKQKKRKIWCISGCILL